LKLSEALQEGKPKFPVLCGLSEFVSSTVSELRKRSLAVREIRPHALESVRPRQGADPEPPFLRREGDESERSDLSVKMSQMEIVRNIGAGNVPSRIGGSEQVGNSSH